MENREGLKNFSMNMKSIMEKCRDGKKLTKDEQKSIVEYWLEVIHTLSLNP